MGRGFLWGGAVFFGLCTIVLWASGGLLHRVEAVASLGMALIGVVAALRPRRADVGPPPTERETEVLREHLLRAADIGGAIGGLGVGLGAAALGAVGGSWGARRGARRAFDNSPSVVIERTIV